MRQHKCSDGAIVREVLALDGPHLVCKCAAYRGHPHQDCSHIEEAKRLWGETADA